MAKGVKRGRASRLVISLPSRQGRRRRTVSARPISARRAVPATRPRPQKLSSTLRISLTRPAPTPPGIGDPKRLFLGSASMAGHGAGPAPQAQEPQGSMARVLEVAGAGSRGEAREDGSDTTPERAPRARCSAAQPVFGFGEGRFDRSRIRAAGRQERKVGAGRADRVPHRLAPGAAEGVHPDDLARAQGRNRNPFDTGSEDVAAHGTVDHPGRVDAVMAQRGEEGGGVPMPEGRRPGQASALGRPARQRGQVGLHPGLVNEHQPRRINAPLRALPAVAAALHIRAFTLLGDHRLLANRNPRPRRNRQTALWLTAIPRRAGCSCSIASVICGQART